MVNWVALWEFEGLFPEAGGFGRFSLAISPILFAGAYRWGERGILLALFICLLAMMAFALTRVRGGGDIKEVLPLLTSYLFGLGYISLFLSYFLLLKRREIVFLLTLIWTVDTLAYFTGRGIGRRKLSPHVSPNKTVEGAIGGLLGGLLASLLSGPFLLEDHSPLYLIAAGLGIGVVCQVGDLTESLCKRWAGVKDSGRLIPGHGGLLDRIDSILVSVPFFYYLHLFFGKM